MKSILTRLLASTLAVAVAVPPTLVQAQYASSAPVQTQPAFGRQEIEQLLAPVALYPDQLLTQILTAATYPLEVVEASRWLDDPQNAQLKGDQLVAALQNQDWDPSVKSLVPFPQIVHMMNDKLDWTERLGDAFLAQQAEVMGVIQDLRQEALAAGTLRSTPQQTVTTEGQTVIIMPNNPEVIYVPVYNPMVVYGPWPYPDYPPYYFPPYPGYDYGDALLTGIAFGLGFLAIDALWGWGDFDWYHHDIRIYPNRFNRINPHHARYTSQTWQHDAYHRRGVMYRDSADRQKYGRSWQSAPMPSRDLRGYDQSRQQFPATHAGQQLRPAAVPHAATPNLIGPPRPVTTPQGTVFDNIQRGSETRSQSERGRASRGVMSPASPRGAAPSGYGGGGGRGDGGGRGGGGGGGGGGGHRH